MEKKVWNWEEIKLAKYLVRQGSGEVYRIGYAFFTQWSECRYYMRRVTTSTGEIAKNNSLTIYGLSKAQLIRHINHVEYHLPTIEIFSFINDDEEKLVSELINAEIERSIALLIFKGGVHRNRRYESRQDALEAHAYWSKKVDDIEYGLWQDFNITRDSNPELFYWPKTQCN